MKCVRVRAGWRVEQVWTDEREWFSVQLLTVPDVDLTDAGRRLDHADR